MTKRQIAGFTLFLALLGAGWGFTQPLSVIAVSTGHGHFGLIFWQLVIGATLLTAICLPRGIRLPLGPRYLAFYLFITMIGTLVPNTASYQAAVHVPSGILSILLSMVPMFAFPVALLMGLDSFSWKRFAGLMSGLFGVLLIILPDARMTLEVPVFWCLVALIAGFCYGIEGNVVSKWGTHGLSAFQVLWGGSILGAVIALPLAVGTGQFIDPRTGMGEPEWALVLSSVIHVFVYSGYVWLVGKAGSVFAVQVSYLVTAFGLIWAKLILGESYAPTIWAALAAMFLGMYLVQPRPKAALVRLRAINETDD